MILLDLFSEVNITVGTLEGRPVRTFGIETQENIRRAQKERFGQISSSPNTEHDEEILTNLKTRDKKD